MSAASMCHKARTQDGKANGSSQCIVCAVVFQTHVFLMCLVYTGCVMAAIIWSVPDSMQASVSDITVLLTCRQTDCNQAPSYRKPLLLILSSLLPKETETNNCDPTLILTSKAPAPNTVAPSSRVFLTARKPSLMASLICARVWSAGPLIRMVQEVGLRTSSTKVYLSSPNTCSYTLPAYLRVGSSQVSNQLIP